MKRGQKLKPKTHCTSCGKSFDEVERYSYKEGEVVTSKCVGCALMEGRQRRKKYAAKANKMKLKLIKSKGGQCAGCGYNDLSCLAVFDFHHPDPTKKTIGNGQNFSARMRGDKDAIKELKGCILLCSNCHRKVHHES